MSEEFFRRLLEKGSAGNREEAAVDLLLEQMDESSATALRRLALPHHYTLAELRILNPELTEEKASELYARLNKLSMISAVNGRHHLHDRARAHLFQAWLTPERRSEFKILNARLASYYASQIDPTNALGAANDYIFHAVGADPAVGFDLLEKRFEDARQRQALNDCQALANLVLEYDALLTAPLKARLSVIQAQVAMLKRSWDEAISRMQAVLNEISPTDSLRIKVLLRMGSCYTQKRMWQSAIECLCRAEAAAKQHDDVACEVLAAQELAATHREQGDLEHAEDAARRALDKAVTNQARAASYNVLGTVYLRRGNFDAAERAFNRSLEHLQETSDHFRRAKVLNNLGLLHADTARWPAA